jgi:hypothetical protein
MSREQYKSSKTWRLSSHIILSIFFLEVILTPISYTLSLTDIGENTLFTEQENELLPIKERPLFSLIYCIFLRRVFVLGKKEKLSLSNDRKAENIFISISA